MKLLVVVLAALSMTTLSGCVGEWFIIRTVDEMQHSEIHSEHTSTKSPDAVTSCMMQTLYNYTNAKGVRQYAAVTTQTFGSTQTITLRVVENLATRMYGIGSNEMFFLIENSVRDGGAKSNMWVSPYILSPSPQEYLNTLAGVVQVCL